MMITVYPSIAIRLKTSYYEADIRTPPSRFPHNDIIIGNLNKKQMIRPCLSTKVSSDRVAPGIAAAENEENLWSDKSKSRGRYKGVRGSEIKSVCRGTEKYKLRAPGTVLVAVLTFVACLQEIPQLQPRAIVGILQTFHRSPLSSACLRPSRICDKIYKLPMHSTFS